MFLFYFSVSASCHDNGPCLTENAERDGDGICNCPVGTRIDGSSCAFEDGGGSGAASSSDANVVVNDAALDDTIPARALDGAAAPDVGGQGTAADAGGLTIPPACMPTSPPTEFCDGQDNNCDGNADEGLQNACGAPCTAPVPPEDCATITDDNCNGQVNEGCLTTCVPSVPRTEVCDGKDNDCNGKVDDACMSSQCGTPCTIGEGQCLATGTYECTGTSMVCDAKVVFPNLIRDPGFEEQTSFVVAAPWTNFMGAQIETLGSAHLGSKNALVTSMPGNSTDFPGWNDVFQRIKVEANSKYKLVAWAKTSPNATNVLIGARDGADFMIILGSRNYPALGGYTLLSTEFVAQSDTADVFVGVFQGEDGSPTTIAVDDVSVTLQRVCL